MKIALITGITGQDGSYLAELLLEKNYEVHGIIRRSSSFNTKRIDHIFSKLNLHYGDLIDAQSTSKLINMIKPHEIYNLGAQSHVKVSFDMPNYTAEVDALGTLSVLEAIRLANLEKHTRFYQASTSELFGKVQEIPQNEKTPFYPRSPYGVAKLYGFWIVKNYREAYGIHASSGILFNHESPRRGETFVTKKITSAFRDIKRNKINCMELGNLNAKRDWGHAKDFVRAMWLMLQQDAPDDYVISTGEQYSVRDFVERAGKEYGFDIDWIGDDLDEVGVDKNSGKTLVKVNKKYFRPTEVDSLLGDYSKAKKILNWKPEISFNDLVSEMCSDETL